MTETKESLKQEFIDRDDAFWGITPDEHSGSTFENGLGLFCTGFALTIQEKLGDRVKVWGFYSADNPGTVWDRLADGHDFAVIDNRFIVDPFAVEFEAEGTGIYDLEDPEDRTEVLRIYGDQANWEVVDPAPTPTGPSIR